MNVLRGGKKRDEIAIDCYLAHNFGDDLFLHSLLRRYPDERFCMIADESYRVWAEEYDNIRIVIDDSEAEPRRTRFSRRLRRETTLFRKVDLFSHSRALVVIGGSIFMQPRHRSAFLNVVATRHALLASRAMYAASTYTFICGANFGPYADESYKNAYKEIFRKHCTDVCFRDRYSKGLFGELRNVRYAPDILFGCPPRHIRKRKQVLFSVVDLGGNSQKFHELSGSGESYDAWILAATRYYSNLGYDITYCSFCSDEGDEVAVRRLALRAGKIGIVAKSIIYENNIDVVLNEIAASEIIVATRFHASVLGFTMGAKVLPIIYSSKTRNILEDMQFDLNNALDLRSFEACDITICERVLESQPHDVHDVANASEGHFEAIDSYFGAKSNETI